MLCSLYMQIVLEEAYELTINGIYSTNYGFFAVVDYIANVIHIVLFRANSVLSCSSALFRAKLVANIRFICSSAH